MSEMYKKILEHGRCFFNFSPEESFSTIGQILETARKSIGRGYEAGAAPYAEKIAMCCDMLEKQNEALLAQVEELTLQIGLLKISCEHKETLLESCDDALDKRDKYLIKLRSETEEETISRAIEFLDDNGCEHSGKLYSLISKHQTTELLEK